jgi:pantothenate kinase
MDSLVDRLKCLLAEKGDQGQVWVALAGPPGAGKSTISSQLVSRLPNAIIIPMDGFHYSKAYLETMPDPALAFARRGADWTFDANKFVNLLKLSHENGTGKFPSFDHSQGDPVEDDIELRVDHQFVIIEGLYLLLSKEPWSQIKDLVDLTIFIDCREEVLTSRLISRHMEAFRMTKEDAEHRVVTNDLPNAVEVFESKDRADIILSK